MITVCPELGTATNTIIITDSEAAITNSISTHLPSVHSFPLLEPRDTRLQEMASCPWSAYINGDGLLHIIRARTVVSC